MDFGRIITAMVTPMNEDLQVLIINLSPSKGLLKRSKRLLVRL